MKSQSKIRKFFCGNIDKYWTNVMVANQKLHSPTWFKVHPMVASQKLHSPTWFKIHPTVANQKLHPLTWYKVHSLPP